MKIYLPIAKIDAEQRLVYGYASTEARDDQGEIVKREALAAALGDYMRFGNIREMHQLSAVGKAKDAVVDDKGLYLGAKVVDPEAWEKVKEGVYNGFSIGGKVLERAAGDPKTISKLRLDEISLVDRPANPEAVFDCWKRGFDAASTPDPILALKAAIERIEALTKGGDEPGDGSIPGTARKGGLPGDYGDVAYADPGYQGDKKKRYPLDSEQHIRAAWNYIHKPKNAGKYSAEEVAHIKSKIVAAWKDKIDPKGPPAAEDGEKAAQVEMQKHLADTGFIADTVLRLDYLKDMLVTEAAVEGDASPLPAQLEEIVDELCGFLNNLVAEETAEIKTDSEDMGGSNAELAPAEAGVGLAAIATSLKKQGLDGRAKIFEALAKARHSMADQALLDVAHGACAKARDMDGIGEGDKVHCAAACDAMKAAGAHESFGIDATQDTGHNPEHPAPQATPPAQQYRPGAYTTVNTADHVKAVIEAIEAALGKRSGVHKALMCVAHDCLGRMTDGAACKSEKAGGRHSKETLGQLQEAHDHLCAAGAKCDAAGEMDEGKPGAEEERQGTEFEPGKAMPPGDLQKRYDALAAAVGELAPRLDAIMKTVERIDKAPLPALTARNLEGLRRVEKGGAAAVEDDEAVMARIAKMSPDEQALLLVKAARRKPILGAGPVPVHPLAGGGNSQ